MCCLLRRTLRYPADLVYLGPWYPLVNGRFQEESEPSETVEQLAAQMLPSQHYDDLHILKGPYVMEDWDPELVKVLLCRGSPFLRSHLRVESRFAGAVVGAHGKSFCGGVAQAGVVGAER